MTVATARFDVPTTEAELDDLMPVQPIRATNHAIYGNGTNGTNDGLELKRLCLLPASNVRMEPVEWLWHGRIPRGKVTAIEGRMGTGKTTLMAAIMAAVTRPLALPAQPAEGHAAAILISLEDDPADTLAPRLAAAGADLTRCHLFDGYEFAGERTGGVFNLLEDIERLRTAIEEKGAVFVGIDPLVATLPSSLSYKDDQDVRRVLAPLSQLAADTGAAICFIRHFRKGGGAVEDAGGGSVGIGAACRSVLRVDQDPENPERYLLSSVKSSVSRKPATIGYRIEETTLPGEIITSRVSWDGESSWTAEALAAHATDTDERPRATEAQDWLRDALTDGQRAAKELFRAAEADGIPRRTLQRAADVLKVVKSRKGFGEGSVWSLPSFAPFAPSGNMTRMDGTNGEEEIL